MGDSLMPCQSVTLSEFLVPVRVVLWTDCTFTNLKSAGEEPPRESGTSGATLHEAAFWCKISKLLRDALSKFPSTGVVLRFNNQRSSG
ncbi:hypothetical protein HPB47_016053 [Ixodes persulcatus]|uniref:Uncharacterized protein n=1 Tax=Ixodes persulcatus TaxID=34615 RepID=A0AC60QSR6_IXOPE|nr:hypothetical protein HPB47_016053 [Ixodes persulcatus]